MIVHGGLQPPLGVGVILVRFWRRAEVGESSV